MPISILTVTAFEIFILKGRKLIDVTGAMVRYVNKKPPANNEKEYKKFDMTNIYFVISGYAMYLLGSSIAINLTLIWFLVDKKRAIELDKIKIKITTILEFEFKTNPDERYILIKKEVEELKKQLNQYKNDRKYLFITVILFIIIYSIASRWEKIKEFFNKHTSKNNKESQTKTDKAKSIKVEQNPDNLLKDIEEIEKLIEDMKNNKKF
jgi:hypothetical protein